MSERICGMIVFFKQKTAYEMRISDWSSDVCSSDLFVKRLSEGVATIAAAFAPEPVIVRMSDFKSNEYANLIAGKRYEPHEENPMLGFRGASRYISESFRPCFELERSEEHTSELQSLMRISYAVFCLKKKKNNNTENPNHLHS